MTPQVPTTPELSSLASKMDPDLTGKIEFASFYSAMAAFVKPQYGRAVLDKAFDEISGYDEQMRVKGAERGHR